jgi:hypothetical protein
MSDVPLASRPHMPGYGLPPAGDGMWPWQWAEDLLTRAVRYWLATARAGGRPHLMPLWAVWHGGALWFSTGDGSVKATNLAARPRCCVGAELAARSVVLEGDAHRVPMPADVLAAYGAKYREGVPPGEPVYRLPPAVAFGLSDAEGEFVRSTRWRFPGATS